MDAIALLLLLIFASEDLIVFGSIGGRVLVWDARTGKVCHELDHENGGSFFGCRVIPVGGESDFVLDPDVMIQAVAVSPV